MKPGQLGALVMLGGYRTNGPYAWMMRNLGHLYPLMADRLGFVHVISSMEVVTKPEFVKAWQFGEVYAKSRGVPLTVLYDHQDQVVRRFNFETSPVLLLIDRDGTILFQGYAEDDGPFWKALLRMQPANVIAEQSNA